jgi:threonyl-tRNA synthetase
MPRFERIVVSKQTGSCSCGVFVVSEHVAAQDMFAENRFKLHFLSQINSPTVTVFRLGSWDITSHHITPHHITSHHITSHHITSLAHCPRLGDFVDLCRGPHLRSTAPIQAFKLTKVSHRDQTYLTLCAEVYDKPHSTAFRC